MRVDPTEAEQLRHGHDTVARWATVSVLLAWAFACGPLLLHGFPHGHDASYELFRIAGYRNAIADGQWPPFWGGDFFVGYGSPIYLFYAPAYMTFASAASALTGSLLSASVWVAVACLALAAFGCYRAAMLALTPTLAGSRHVLSCMSASAFVLHPYLLSTLYLRNALAEFAAMCLFPLTLWSLLRVGGPGRDDRLVGALWVAVITAASVLTHNLSALVATTFLLWTAGMLYGRRPQRGAGAHNGRGRVSAVVAGFGLGLLLAAYFWLPAVGYNDITRTAIELRKGKLDFHNNFVPFTSLFGFEKFYATGPLLPLVLGVGFGLGLRPVVGRAGSPVGLLPGLVPIFAPFTVVLLLLQFRVTTPVWEHLPYLALVQFPWRFLGQLGLIGALMLAVVMLPVLGRVPRGRWPLVQAAVTLLWMAQASVHLGQARPLPKDVQQGFDAASQPEAMRNNPGAMATFRWEYIPRNADRDIWRGDSNYLGPVHHTIGSLSAHPVHDSPRRIEVRLDAPRDATAREASAVVFRRWLFPGWQAHVDGKPAQVSASFRGLVTVAVPVGARHLVVELKPPPLRRLATGISLVGLLLVALIVLVRKRRSPVGPADRRRR